jgi:hypothetical protein
MPTINEQTLHLLLSRNCNLPGGNNSPTHYSTRLGGKKHADVLGAAIFMKIRKTLLVGWVAIERLSKTLRVLNSGVF